VFLPLVALILGILLSPCLDPHALWICLGPAILLSFARRSAAYLSIFLIGALAAAYGSASPVPLDPGDTAVRLIGTLVECPEWRGLGAYLDVRMETIDGYPSRGRARLTEFLDDPESRRMFEELQLGSGDRLEILVKLRRPTVYQNPGVFNFRHYLERQGIYWTGTIRNPRLITVLDRGWHTPDHIKAWIQRRLEQPFKDDRGVQGLVLGMVLGKKYALTAEVERQFQAGGLYHLVVVSGFNLAVVSTVAFWFAGFVPVSRQSRLVFVLACSTCYAALVEGGTPVHRALLMVIFVLGGRLLDRGYAPFNTLAGAAFIILLADPASIEDSSFQMTFSAVVAVIGLGVPLNQWLFGWLREALKNLADSSKDAYLPSAVVDWRIARRVWCELYGLPVWVVTIPWTIVLIAGEAAVIAICVEVIFLPFMVESFHRFTPMSPVLNIPAGMIAAVVTPLGLSLILLPAPVSDGVAWIVGQLLTALISLLHWTHRTAGGHDSRPVGSGLDMGSLRSSRCSVGRHNPKPSLFFLYRNRRVRALSTLCDCGDGLLARPANKGDSHVSGCRSGRFHFCGVSFE
jgi:ComEC/Rec2-related protein